MRVLSIAGGGIKGIIPATFLAHLEDSTGKRVKDLFDLCVGTSTGGVLALAFTKPIPFSGEGAVKWYLENAGDIFPNKAFSTLRNLFECRYSAKGLELVLQKAFENVTIEKHSPVCCTAFNLQTQAPAFLSNRSATFHTMLSWEAARCTSAAPTYFSAYRDFVDGGTVANSPSVVAISEAVGRYRCPAHDVKLLHLGCGWYADSQARLAAAGQFDWLHGLPQTLIGGSDTLAGMLCSRLLPPGQYLGVNPPITAPHVEMDNISSKNLDYLREVGQGAWRRDGQRVRQFLGV